MFLIKIFLGIVYFRKGQKRPIMVLNQFEYKVERQTTPTNMCWCCVTKEKNKCRARIVTFHDQVVIKRRDHNHEPTFKGDCAMEHRRVYISYGSSKAKKTVTRKNIKTLKEYNSGESE